LELEVPKLSKNLIEKTLDVMNSFRRDYLLKKSTSEILDILYKNLELWSDPNYGYRRKAEEWIPITMGFSPRMTYKILNTMIDNFKEDLHKIHVSGGKNIERIFCVSPSVPGPQALIMINALVNKCAVFCKSSFDDIFAPLYAQSHVDVDEKIAGCIAVVPWEGGKNEYQEIEEFVYGERSKGDAIAVLGRRETYESIRGKASSTAKIIPFVRGISLGIIGKEMLTNDEVEEIALQAALAVCMYDQRNCFSPQLYYVEKGGKISPEEFSRILARKMQDIELEIPRGELPLDASATITELMKTYELLDLTGDLELHEIRRENMQTGAVIYKKDKQFESSCLYRVVRVKPIDDVNEVPELLKPLSESIHTIGVALSEEKRNNLIKKLDSPGVKISSMEKMYQPSILEYELFGN
jgi:hypothetical protein